MANKINWVEVMEDNSEAIVDAIKLAKGEAYGCMQGWHIDVEIDEDGKVWTGGLNSHGSQSMSSYKGETFIVCHVDSWEVDIDEAEDIKYSPDIYAEYLAQQEDDDGHDSAWEFMENKYPEIRQQWKNDARDFEISEFDAGELLDRAIEKQIAYHQFD